MRPAGSPFLIRPTPSRRPLPSVEAAVVGLAVIVVAFILVLTLSTAPAQASGAHSVEVRPGLSLLGETVTLRIEGTGAEPEADTEVAVRFGGPADPSQVGQTDPLLPEAAAMSTTVGASLLRGSATTGTGSGTWSMDVNVPGNLLDLPGGYLVTVELRSGGLVGSTGQAWFGKVAPRARPLDVAFVLPVALGVHRDPSGVFFDRVLEQAVAPSSGGPADLRAVTELSGRFPDWRFTLAFEPILLTQLRDMADGYVRLGDSGTAEEVSAEDPSAKNAVEVLAAFRDLAGRETIETAAGPYAGAALGALAAEGWWDGFDQIQLGKQELQQTLGLEAAPIGACSPDLDMTTESLAYYGRASIDHVVVDGQLAADLTEPVDDGTVAARVRDANNDRVTLVFANSRLHTLMGPPWDPAVFYAGFAAEVAAVPGEAMVILPGGDFVVPPGAYLEAIGESLTGAAWLEMHTLTSLLRVHAPDTRPVLLARSAGGPQGYIEGALLSSLRAAHAAVVDLATAADPTEGPVESAHRLLYVAESRWWWHPQTSPQVASVGLLYAEEALVTAQTELDKVSFSGASPARILGRRGTVTLTVDNGADYPLEVQVQLTGDGLSLPDGSSLAVELEPGRNEMPVEVDATESPYRLDIRLMVGASVLDEGSHSVRPITVMTFVPWAVVAAVVVAAVVFAILWIRRRRSHA